MPSVAILSPDPTNPAGGVERVCLSLRQALEQHGWSATVVGPDRWPTRWEYRFGVGYPLMSWHATRSSHKLKPDAIVSNGYLGIGLNRFASIPRVHLYHGTLAGGTRAISNFLPRREYWRRMLGGGLSEALAGHTASRVVCVSEETALEVGRCYRVRVDRVIPNAVDTALFLPRDRTAARRRLDLAPDARYALFVGRLEPGKGGSFVAAAAQRAGFELLVAGPTGSDQARQLGILAPEELAYAYAACDCVVLPSLYEACSLVVLEALACERPLLTTPVGWMRSLLAAVPAYAELCVEPTVDSVAEGLKALATMDTQTLTSTARQYIVEHNNLQGYSRQWDDLLGELIA
jgi:glycosyltransferase involved in cell wall biosynthesis